MTEIASVAITDDQALHLSQALSLALENSTEEQVGEIEDSLKQLSVFFGLVAAHPERFPTTGRMAKAIKSGQRAAKGPAQPQSRRNRRKARQENRMSFSKRRRKQRAEDVANFNAAQEAIAREMEEMNEAYAEQMARAEELLEAETLTPDELRELFSISGAPPALMEALGKLSTAPKLIVPGA